MNAKDILDLLKKDWDSQSNFLKYCYLLGAVAFFTGWLYKGDAHLLTLAGHNITVQRACLTGMALSLVGTPLLYQLFIRLRIQLYRLRYPLERIGKDFHFQQLPDADAVHLIDTKRKQIRWIENSQTAYDLGYHPSLWADMIARKNYVEKGEVINIDTFTLKRGIRTRGKPGE